MDSPWGGKGSMMTTTITYTYPWWNWNLHWDVLKLRISPTVKSSSSSQLLHLFLPQSFSTCRRFLYSYSYQKPKLSLITLPYPTHILIWEENVLSILPPRYISNLILFWTLFLYQYVFLGLHDTREFTTYAWQTTAMGATEWACQASD